MRRDGRTFVIGNDSAVVIWEHLADEHRLKPLFMQTSPGFYAHRINRKNTCTAMGEAYRRAFALASDGPYVAIADAAAGTVSVCVDADGVLRPLAVRGGLSAGPRGGS